MSLAGWRAAGSCALTAVRLSACASAGGHSASTGAGVSPRAEAAKEPLKALPPGLDPAGDADPFPSTYVPAASALVAVAGSRDCDNLRQARFNAGTAVANGLPYGAALASLTINPARMWGLADVGSLEVGKAADLAGLSLEGR